MSDRKCSAPDTTETTADALGGLSLTIPDASVLGQLFADLAALEMHIRAFAAVTPRALLVPDARLHLEDALAILDAIFAEDTEDDTDPDAQH